MGLKAPTPRVQPKIRVKIGPRGRGWEIAQGRENRNTIVETPDPRLALGVRAEELAFGCCPDFRRSAGFQPALSRQDGGATFKLGQHLNVCSGILGRSQESEVITKPFRYEVKGINRGASWGREALCVRDSGGFVLRAACFYFRFLTPDS